MPIGTPKIGYTQQDEEEDKTVFLTVYEELHDARILLICKNMELSLVNRTIALLLFLNEEDDTDISLFINSHGGEILPAMALYDTLEFLYCDVCTLALGLVASTASLILVGGTMCKRIGFPHARIMIHQPSTDFFRGRPREIQVEAEELCELRNTIAEIFTQHTGKPKDVIEKDLERDTFMSANEAKDYGIIDRIVSEKNPFSKLLLEDKDKDKDDDSPIFW